MGQGPPGAPVVPSKAGQHPVLMTCLHARPAPVWITAGGLAWVRASVCRGMGIVCGRFTGPVWYSGCGGLCGSESGAGAACGMGHR